MPNPAPALCLVLGDQLTPDLPSLQAIVRGRDVVLLVEVQEEATYVRHHKKKIAFLFAAMRHFAEELRAAGHRVDYVRLDDPSNTHSFSGEVAQAVARHAVTQVHVTEPGEWRVLQAMQGWQAQLGLPVSIHPDTRFLCSSAAFRQWAQGRRQLRMEFFYRDMRTRHQLLMAGDKPLGGEWNYDKENRKPPKGGLQFPARPEVVVDAITRDVLALVAERFSDHFGVLEPFSFAVTRGGAQQLADHFIRYILPFFGDYQDAMLVDEPYMYHSVISMYLNCGLLDPLALCREAEAAYHAGWVPLPAAEGFIRQILGWREFVRGIYWLHMPAYQQLNHLQAQRPLPAFYWTADTHMRCMAQAITQTQQNAYAHHIQRLMVTGNFALLAGLDPDAVCEWYLLVYADAYDWVELPNTRGMALYADGGIVGSKPYAASGKYIDRMSDYCKGCHYNVAESTGEGSCPFNALYWHFVNRHAALFARNPRMGTIYAGWTRMDPARRAAIIARGDEILEKLDREEKI